MTLGVYSPWAKVRKTKYFYQNTRLDGFVFDYHAFVGDCRGAGRVGSSVIGSVDFVAHLLVP